MGDPFRNDLIAAQTRIEGLESENLRLRAGISDDAMRRTQRATRVATVAVVGGLLAVVGLTPPLIQARAESERLRAQLDDESFELGRLRLQNAMLTQPPVVRPRPPPPVVPVNQPIGAVSLGCFVDSGDARPGTSGRDLDGRVFVMPALTPQMCVDRCAREGFHYAGVQFTNQCFCGDSYGRFGSAPAKDCSAVCAGDGQQSCGGTWRNDVYEIAKR